MHYMDLGRTGLRVSRICLGTMTFGEQNTTEEGFAQMDMALERGVNFFDTAEMYSFPSSPETQGDSERVIGDWMTARKNRDQIIVASKIIGPGDGFRHVRAYSQRRASSGSSWMRPGKSVIDPLRKVLFSASWWVRRDPPGRSRS